MIFLRKRLAQRFTHPQLSVKAECQDILDNLNKQPGAIKRGSDYSEGSYIF